MSESVSTSKSTHPFNTKGTLQNDALEALVKLVVPDQKTKESVQATIKKLDWTGRVIANINISRNAVRTILNDADAFKFFKKRAVQEVCKVIGQNFFVKVQMVDVEEKTTVQHFLKVRVSKKNAPTPAPAPAPAPLPTNPQELEELRKADAMRRFTLAQQKMRDATTVTLKATVVKNYFADLDDED